MQRERNDASPRADGPMRCGRILNLLEGVELLSELVRP